MNRFRPVGAASTGGSFASSRKAAVHSRSVDRIFIALCLSTFMLIAGCTTYFVIELLV
jgi:hypothetical protein